jgi:hypothetical protein
MSEFTRTLTKESAQEPVEIIVSGGFQGANPFMRATFGGMEIVRADGESETDFKWRARLLAKADGVNCIVFGGLPTNWSPEQ